MGIPLLIFPLFSAGFVAAQNLKPTHKEYFDYNNGAWELALTSNLEYDERGNIIRDESNRPGEQAYRNILGYNSDNMLISEDEYVLDGGEWVHNSTNLLSYDSVVKKWRIGLANTDYIYNSTFRWYINVQRDGSGNITSAAYYWDDNDTPDALQYEVGIEYDNEGKATKITETNYNTEVSHKQRVWTNLVWENTDGQIVTNSLGASGSVYDCFLKGANRLKSADVAEDGEHKWTLTVDYSGEKDYSAKYTRDNAIIRSDKLEYTDSHGSYVQTLLDDGKWTQTIHEYDEHGNRTLVAKAQGTDPENLDPESSSFYENEYEPATGCLIQTITYDSENGETPEPSEKVTYSDFIDVSSSSITMIENDIRTRISVNGLTISAKGSGGLTVYTLDGRLVGKTDNDSITVPSSGLYIISVDGRTTKIII